MALLLPGASSGSALELPATIQFIEAGLLEPVAELPTFAEATVDAVLDAYLDETPHAGKPKGVRLVPGRLASLADLGRVTGDEFARRASRSQMLDTLRAAAWADGTQRTYGSAVVAWRVWCRAEGVPALPFDPAHVANFLLDYAFVWEGNDVVLDDDGGPMPAVAAATVAVKLAALNRAAEFIGLARPGDNPVIQELMRGVRRRLGTAPESRKAALDLKAIIACLAVASGKRFAAVRTRAAVLLRAKTGASAGQLARLEWADVRFASDGVHLTLAPAHRHGGPTIVFVPAHRTASVCLVRVLLELRGMSINLAHVLAHPPAAGGKRSHKGDAMTRQALHLAVDSSARDFGGWDSLPNLSDREVGRLLASECPVATVASTRDRALLLGGSWTAARRSNLSALNWRDVDDYGVDGISLKFRRSKTDQEGRGRVKWLPAAERGADTPCPAQALRDYKQALESALGRRVSSDEPVFVALTGHGAPKFTGGRLVRLTGDSINDVVQQLAVAAGLTPGSSNGQPNPFGAHSLRSGFVTEALRGDKLSIAEVQDVTDHVDVGVLMDYRREVNAPTSNPARRMLGRLA